MFWSSSWADKTFQRQLKESRKIEDIILAFVSASTRALKKELDLVDGGWKTELNAQILVFLDLLSDNLNAVGSAAVELRNRLNTYRARLSSNEKASSTQATAVAATVKDDEHTPAPESDSVLSTAMVAELFHLDSAALAERLQAIRHLCTVDAALDDLKVRLDSPSAQKC